MKSEIKGDTGVLDMTQNNAYRVMVKFALPVFVTELFQQLYNTADTFIVGKFLGTEALAAVGSSGPLIFLIVSFFAGTGMGGGVAIARFFGAKDDKNVSEAIHTNIAFGLVCGVCISLLGFFLSPVLLKLMNTDASILPLATEYFRYYFSGVITVVMYNVLKGILQAVGDSKRPLYYLIISSLLNIGLDCLFIGGFGWGVWSAAVATIISQFLSCVLCAVHLMKKGHVYSVSVKKIRFRKKMLGLIVKYGLPAGIQNCVIALANVIVQSQINSFGKMATAAYGAYTKVEGFTFIPVQSFTMAISTFVSQNLGAKQYARAKKGSAFGIISAMAIAELVGIIIYIFAPQIVGFFDSTPEVVAYGVTQARTVALFYGLLAMAHAIASVCRGAGKAFVAMFTMLSIWCVFRIIYIITVMNLYGQINLVFWAYPITWGISCVVYLIYYLKADWPHGFEKKHVNG